MILLPRQALNCRSPAERRIHELLAASDLPDSVRAFHSLNLSSHEYKRWAEADFVIVLPELILVLEVKGGRVACAGGRWTYTNRAGKEFSSSEGPFQQSASARYALETLLCEKLGESFVKSRCSFGWGVVFPDFEFDIESVEFDQRQILDESALRKLGIDSWIRELAEFWLEKENRRRKTLDPAEIRTICSVLRPEFDRIPSLHSRICQAEEVMISLTEEQYKLVDIMIAQRRNVVTGGAGTGKTLLAAHAATVLAEQGVQVRFVCRSPVLLREIREKLRITGVEVCSYEHLALTETPAAELLIVDEGQDFLDLECLEVLDRAVAGGFSKGQWLFFMDANNQASIYADPDRDVLDFISSSGAPFPLTRNCRNTREIALKTVLYTGGDIGTVSASIPGLKVDDTTEYAEPSELAAAMERQLAVWVDEDAVEPAQITILSPVELEESVVSRLDKRWRRRISVVDELSGINQVENMLRFSTIRNFKGLESRFVMLVDLEALPAGSPGISSLYVGMTRANAFLWLAIPRSRRNEFRNWQRTNAERLARGIKEGLADV